MQSLATAAQMKELDRVAIQERGIPSLELMEHAAKGAADVLWNRLPKYKRYAGVVGVYSSRTDLTEAEQRELEEIRAIVESKNQDDTPRVAVFCGPGNNGGDGVAAARLLMDRGCAVRTILVGKREHMTPDCKAMEERLVAVGGKLEDFRPEDRLFRAWLSTCDGIMDALFGVGLNREVGGDFRAAIQCINQFGRGRPVVSCDVPSGIHADTGEVLGIAVKATDTVTFSYAKPGLYLNEGRACSGKVHVEQIGIPHELGHTMIDRQPDGVWAIPDYARLVLPRRPRTAHKGDFGKIFVLAGSEGYTGAPVLASRAAVRAGAGLVFLGVPREVYPIVAVKCDEAMPFPLPQDYQAVLDKAMGCDVALIGPGLGRAPETKELVHSLLRDLDIPVVLDADGINALQGHIDVLDARKGLTVLTPHDGEFQRLSGCELPIRDRLTAARDFAAAHRCVLVLKGHGTVTASPEGVAWICGAGNPGMAKGGSGDVLAGIVAALLGQKHLRSPHGKVGELVAYGVYYHAKAGDLCAQDLGEYAMTPTDMIEALPRVFREHESRD